MLKYTCKQNNLRDRIQLKNYGVFILMLAPKWLFRMLEVNLKSVINASF